MSVYMTQFAYTPGAWEALRQNPQDRARVFRDLVEELGGRMIAFYYSFGDFDGVILYEIADETAAAAVVMSVLSPGHVKAIKTTTLLSVDQAVSAMRKAHRERYEAPVGYAAYCG